MKNALIDKGIIHLSGMVNKDIISLAAVAAALPFAEIGLSRRHGSFFLYAFQRCYTPNRRGRI